MTYHHPSLQELQKVLGSNYSIQTVDEESVLYRDFGNGFNVEVSGCSQTNTKNPATIYLWFGTNMPDCLVVKVVANIGRNADSIRKVVESLHEYSKGLLAQEYDTRDKLFHMKEERHIPSFEELHEALGKEYSVQLVDGEKCLCRDCGRGFSVVVSGCSEANTDKPATSVLWFGTDTPDRVKVFQTYNVGRDADSVKDTVESLCWYAKRLYSKGYKTRGELLKIAHKD